MSIKFNSGMGGSVCDWCRTLICSGFPPKFKYTYSTPGPEKHFMVPMPPGVNGLKEDDLHTLDYCAVCVIKVKLTHSDIVLVTAKELYNL